MAVANIVSKDSVLRQFSFEVLPPLKGMGTERLFEDIAKLCELNPAFINITTHHSEYIYKEVGDGRYERQRVRRRPGTIAVAAAIQQRFKVPVQPHIICSGATIEDIEYELLDLQFLGITDLLLLRGDKAKDDSVFKPMPGGHAHTTDLIRQVQQFNNGFFADGTSLPTAHRSRIPGRDSTSVWLAIRRNMRRLPIWNATWSTCDRNRNWERSMP